MPGAVENLPTLIAGERRMARSGATIDATNPATGELLARFPRCDASDVDDAVSAAQRAQREWWALDPLARAALVGRVADAILAHADELAGLDVADNGSPIREMRNHAHIAAGLLRYFSGLALQLRGDTVPTGFERLDYTLP